MAAFFIKDYVLHSNFKDIVAVTWQVAEDPNFNNIIDETIYDTENIEVWHTPLKRLDGYGYYDETSELHVRVKIYTKNGKHVFESEWFYKKIKDNNISKRVKLTDGNKVVGEIEVFKDGTYKEIW